MRTNIVIDDKLMARVMAGGEFKTKREAVEEGLRLLARRKAYAAIRAARGTFVWDDSDEGWAKVRAQEEAEVQAEEAARTPDEANGLTTGSGAPILAVHEPAPVYVVGKGAAKSKGGKR